MTHVKEIRDVRDGFGPAVVKEMVLDQDISHEFILYLGERGELDYHPHLPRPYFRVVMDGLLQIQGIEGTRTARVTLSRRESEAALASLVSLVERANGDTAHR